MLLLTDTVAGAPVAVRRAFVAVMERMVESDGVLDSRELTLLDALRRTLGIDDDDGLADTDEALLAPFADAVVVQAALLAAADGDLHEVEQDLVHQLAERLGARAQVAERALAWASRGVAWMREGRGLLRVQSPQGAAIPDASSTRDP